MTSLHDRLTDLADAAPSGTRAPDLWAQGRRYGRRRRIEAAALTLVLLGAVGSLVGALLPQASYDVAPADAGASLRLPDRIERPSPWLKGTDDVGPVGPVVALFASTRSSGLFSQDDGGLVAVSASGDYAFLDLPDAAQTSMLGFGRFALSADGRWVAYPVSGDTREEPDGTEGAAVVGLGVYDTVTGDALRLDVPSDHGIALDGLRWVGDRLWFSYGRYVAGEGSQDEGSARGYGSYEWDVTKTPARAEQAQDIRRLAGTTSDGRVVMRDYRRFRVAPGDAGARPVDVRLDVLPEGDVALSPSGTVLALLEDTDGANRSSSGNTKPLRLAPLPASGTGAVETSLVSDVEAHLLRGWRDDQHVVVEDVRSPGLDAVDVDNGARERLTSFPSGDDRVEITVAHDALRAPTYDADGPPYVMAPLLRVGLAVLAVLLAGLALLIWRRRGRV